MGCSPVRGRRMMPERFRSGPLVQAPPSQHAANLCSMTMKLLPSQRLLQPPAPASSLRSQGRTCNDPDFLCRSLDKRSLKAPGCVRCRVRCLKQVCHFHVHLRDFHPKKLLPDEHVVTMVQLNFVRDSGEAAVLGSHIRQQKISL